MAALATNMRHFGLVDAMAQQNADAPPDYRALVCIFLNGGNDGNNTVVPNHTAGYAQYSAARAAQGLAIPQASLLPITPPSIGLNFGLHPNLTELKTLWDQQKLAIVTNAGPLVQPLTRAQYQAGMPRPMQLFSHSDQSNQHRTAISATAATTGWGGRMADRTGALNPGAAIAMVTSVNGTSLFTAGNTTTPLVVAPAPTPLNQVFALNGFVTGNGEDNARRASMDLIRMMDADRTLVRAASDLTQQAVSVSTQLSSDPPLTVTFPNTTLGNQLKQVAKLMKFHTQLNMSRQIFYVQSAAMFDTHTSQLSRQAPLMVELSQAMKAFYDETVAQGIASQVTTFSLSDFSRTLNPTGTGSGAGSDHAWGNHVFVMGGAVRGGDFYGTPGPNGTVFPTLVGGGPDDTDTRGRFIPTTSVEMFAATLASWYGVATADIPLVFPYINNFPTANLGFMM
jgi:uncharacterized protein (DUF1501 family)